ncbi:hypothetical protein [Nonomuraea angiospora]|nr:hypothetical protein [Nonomuraea angiospora]
MPNIGVEPKHAESVRAKLERMVGRGVLIEPESGLSILRQPHALNEPFQAPRQVPWSQHDRDAGLGPGT